MIRKEFMYWLALRIFTLTSGDRYWEVIEPLRFLVITIIKQNIEYPRQEVLLRLAQSNVSDCISHCFEAGIPEDAIIGPVILLVEALTPEGNTP